MRKIKVQIDEGAELRLHAEEQLRGKTAQPQSIRSREDIRHLDHELDVHRIELEMQNAELRQSRDEVETALDKYTDLYDFAPVGYCTLDRKGAVRSANLTAATLLGTERSKLLGSHFRQFIAAEARLLFPEFLEKVFASEGNVSCEVQLAKEGDTPCFVRIEARALDTGQECRIAVLDVTGRKRAEEKYHQTRSRLAWVLEKASIGMWLNELPLDILNVDEQARRLLYIDPGAEVTMDVFRSRLHPDDRKPVQVAIETAIRDRTLYEVDHRVVDPVSGVIRWCHSTGQVTYAADGTPLSFDGLIYDITEREKTKVELQKAHDELEKQVMERTEELSKANKQLLQEIDEHKNSAESLKGAFAEIKKLKNRLQAENILLQHEIAKDYNFGEIIGQSSAISYVFFRVEQVAAMNATVLILGETGTGKGVVARAIHSRSARKNRPMITVNCTALPANLIESELFGREKGAFTGASARQMGRFELADGGTIFLDEIGEMPLDLQCKLLRVVQDGEFERLGSPRTIKVDVRIIAASNRNLEEEIRSGRFREDLFYRLNVFPITIPPLRQRKEDIPLLVNHFVTKFNKKIGKKIDSVSKETLKSLEEYHWPGNVRELESVIERAVILSQGTSLQIMDRLETSHKPDEEVGRDVKALSELEHDHITQVLQKTGWRIEGKNGAAVILGLNASTLRARMRKFGIARQ